MIPQLRQRKLKVIREEKGLTRTKLAMMSGIQQGLIGQIEMGRVYPYEAQLKKLAEALEYKGDPLELLDEDF